MNEFSTILKDQATTIGVELDTRQIDAFKGFFDDLVEKNKVMNLTAITDMHEVINKHFIDSMMPWKAIDDCLKDRKAINDTCDRVKHTVPTEYAKICDIGTGAGFPGIPLAIIFPETRFTLIDSLNKRINFINEEVDKLGIKNVKAVHGRTEDLAHEKGYREAFDILVSRAVANLSTLSEYALPFVKVGGSFIAYKSADIEEELQNSKKAIATLGGEIVRVEDMRLPQTDIPRKIVIIRKKSETPGRYPRQAGTPAKKPIK